VTPRASTLLLAGLLGCSDIGPAELERGEAELLGTISRQLPTSDATDARAALVRDAWRREHRFLDAAAPGHLFASTRVSQDEIDAGLWSHDALYQLGGQLFTLQFTRAMGLGAATPGLRRVHDGRRGGPDAYGCTTCHWRGGLAGAGDAADNAMLRGDGEHMSSALARNPPALVGAGLRERVAAQMNAELAALRQDTVAFAVEAGYAVRVPLEVRGIRFGHLTVHPDGEVDTSEVEGIDRDLVIKPFGWKGTVASIRDAAEDALLVHHGMQSTHLVDDGDASRVGGGGGDDPDRDGVVDEIVEGQVTALVAFLALLEVPQEEIPSGDPYLATVWARGRLDFETLGCARCHVPVHTIDDARAVLPHRDGGPALTLDLLRDGAEPRLAPAAQDGALTVRLYSDLARHRMGEALAEPRAFDGVEPDAFLTPPLWGVARSRPYLHDGRAPTLEDAILLHGGEAQSSRDAYAALDDAGRAPLRVFLTSLGRATRLVTP